ncbi:TlpA disulfide reductase family protein [Microbacterium sp. T2.11-28]|uniref:TlpA family protein disulfide reductase n=1 Tax=Microbacterium sp. T2.11-28 TaxID=3041169 RepID=UPI00247753FE|nr:TlpA disulfide reductase family protein [Microbacterium sp. T2.11-28]CAI9387243.1 Thiol-disulfide oxidoreductase ResA [Microbacterium sp. T2.11-28]
MYRRHRGALARTHFHRRALPFAVISITALLISGCAPIGGVDQGYTPPDGAGVVSVDGRIFEIAADERGEPVAFSGTSEHGDAIDSATFKDRVYVVNFWYAACGPCRVEAPLLEEVWQKYQREKVGFVGVNIYDQPGTAASFAEQYGITYPSVIDVNDGAVKLAFAAVTPIQATPTTLVMDRQGRVAARIIGELPSASILDTLVKDLLAEGE